MSFLATPTSKTHRVVEVDVFELQLLPWPEYLLLGITKEIVVEKHPWKKILVDQDFEEARTPVRRMCRPGFRFYLKYLSTMASTCYTHKKLLTMRLLRWMKKYRSWFSSTILDATSNPHQPSLAPARKTKTSRLDTQRFQDRAYAPLSDIHQYIVSGIVKQPTGKTPCF